MITAEDVAFVERLLEQTAPQPEAFARDPESVGGIPFQERLSDYLQEMVASWRMYFGRGALRGEADQGEEVWRWQSADDRVQTRAVMEKDADLTIHFSSNEWHWRAPASTFAWAR